MLTGYLFRGGAESAPPCGRHVISEVVAIRVKDHQKKITKNVSFKLKVLQFKSQNLLVPTEP